MYLEVRNSLNVKNYSTERIGPTHIGHAMCRGLGNLLLVPVKIRVNTYSTSSVAECCFVEDKSSEVC